ncbi:protein kinase domain-containing protein [Fervidibacter sacchari]
MVCPNCGHVNAKVARFCSQCGHSLLTQFCPECGNLCDVTETQCRHCRQPLPPPMQRLLGKGMVLANRYRIEKLLGCGGFGAVYLATDLTFEQVGQERKVAIKENHDPSALNAFLKEAGLLANLHHPNLPRVSDFFSEQPPTIPQTRPYMVMDYIAGEELWERIQRQGKLSEKEILDLLGGVFDALEYLHSHNPPIFHRDIKPQNIRITPEGRTFLVDFGIAKVGGGTTTTSSRAATPPFAPPEQYRMAGETDDKSDQYSLAMTIYVALTGKVPIHAEAPLREQAITAGNPDPLEPIEKLAPEVSPRVRKALKRALSVDKNSRFSSIAEFRKALYPPLVAGLTRRQLIAAIAGTALGIGIVSFAGYQIWKWRQPLWLVAELRGHGAGVTWVAFTPDGEKVLSASHDKTVRVWDWRKGKCERVLKGHTDSVRCFALLKSNLVASVSWDGTMRIWNWQMGEQQMALNPKIGRLNAIAVSHDGQWVVVGGDEGACLWQSSSGAMLRLIRAHVRSLALHPNNQTVAVGDSAGQIRLFHLGQKKVTASWQAHAGAVTALAFHPNGAVLLSGGEDATLAVWDVVAVSLVKRLEGWHQREVRAIAFRSDGQIAVSCSMDDRLRVWRTSDWQLILTREGGRNWALALAFSPSGKFLVSASKDETVKVWQVKL